jgi:formylmethanofuran dehydrogenase subunit D
MELPSQGIRLSLVTHEDIYLSIAKQRDGLGEAYQKRSAVVHLSPVDMTKLKLKDGDHIELTSKSGSVVVAVESDNSHEEGTAHMPLSLYSNCLASYDPSLSQLPTLKLIESRATPTEKGVTPLSDLLIRRTGAQERPSTASDL